MAVDLLTAEEIEGIRNVGLVWISEVTLARLLATLDALTAERDRWRMIAETAGTPKMGTDWTFARDWEPI